jgi:hypothetical protein
MTHAFGRGTTPAHHGCVGKPVTATKPRQRTPPKRVARTPAERRRAGADEACHRAPHEPLRQLPRQRRRSIDRQRPAAQCRGVVDLSEPDAIEGPEVRADHQVRIEPRRCHADGDLARLEEQPDAARPRTGEVEFHDRAPPRQPLAVDPLVDLPHEHAAIELLRPRIAERPAHTPGPERLDDDLELASGLGQVVFGQSGRRQDDALDHPGVLELTQPRGE